MKGYAATQVDRMKVEDEYEQIMRDQTELRVFDLADGLTIWLYRVKARFPREKLCGFIRALRDV